MTFSTHYDSAPVSSRPALSRTLAALLALVFLAILIRTAWLSDDALITLRTVMNVTHGFGLTFNIAERVQTFTHPLWLLLLTVGYLVGRNVYLVTFAASIVTSLVVFWIVLTRAASAPQAAVAAAVLLFSRAFIDFSTSGLENPLSSLLVALFVGVFFSQTSTPRRRLTTLAVLTSLLYLTRPDNVLFVLPLLGLACYQVRHAKTILVSLAVGAAPAIAWTLFALVYYGFPFPNTAYAKLATHISREELWRQGVIYLIDSFDRDPLTLTSVFFALVLGVASPRVESRALAFGLALYLVYIVSIGGDFMTGRFLAVPVVVGVLLLSRIATAPRLVWAAICVIFLVVGTASGHAPLWSDSGFSDTGLRSTGLIDERAVYFRNQSLVRATRGQFRDPEWPSSRDAPTRLVVTKLCGLLGVAGLDGGPAVHLLDECALADPLLARLPAVFNPSWRTGHYRRMIPDGYEESLSTGANLLKDDRLRVLYEDVRLLTRSPRLWSRARWNAIRRLNGGDDTALVDVAYYRHGGSVLHVEQLNEVKPDGLPSDAPGTRTFTGPVAVPCDSRPGRRYLDLTLDSDDRYQIMFLEHDVVISTLELGPIPEHRRRKGLASYTVDIPPRARQVGFDIIWIAPSGGDNHYSIGHLLIDGNPETDAVLLQRVARRDEAAGK